MRRDTTVATTTAPGQTATAAPKAPGRREAPAETTDAGPANEHTTVETARPANEHMAVETATIA